MTKSTSLSSTTRDTPLDAQYTAQGPRALTPTVLGAMYAVCRPIGVQSNALCPELSTLSTDTLWPTIASRMGLSERLSRRRHEGSI